MEILKSLLKQVTVCVGLMAAFLTLLSLLTTGSQAGQALDVVLRAGLQAEVVYDGSADGSGMLKISQVGQMAIDPKTGELYFGNSVVGEEDFIMIVNPTSGEVRKFPYFGNGMAFNTDGSVFYFGLVNLMLGVWYRETDEFRKFTILPGVEGVQVVDDGTPKGRLLVANSDYGKNILGVDTVWEVNQDDGFYEPALRFSDGSTEVGVNFAAMDGMGIDGAGSIYTLTGQGKVLIRKSDGSYVEGNSAPVTSSGLMQGGLGASPDGVVYMQDTGSGEIFAYMPDGSQVMVGYGDAFEQANNITEGGITSDGQSIYMANSQGKVIRVFTTDGSPLYSTLQNDLGDAVLNGVITDGTGSPLAGVTVQLRDKSIGTVTTDDNGMFSFALKSGLYHVHAALPNYGDFNGRVTAVATQATDLNVSMASFLPGYLPPGLVADIIATKSADAIEGSSDVTFDTEGNLYSLNHSNGTITKTILDTDSREVVDTFIAVKDGGIANAWAIAVGDDLNMYVSSSNSGLLRLPPAVSGNPQLLTVDIDNPRIVRDEGGVDRMVSYVTDIDGVTRMSNGDIMMSSGSGGSIIDGFPEGTIDSVLRYSPSSGGVSLFSRGITASGGDSVFNNPDLVKVDNEDNLFVTNRGGNIVNVDTSGVATLAWPGGGEGYPEGLSSYTSFNSDGQGHSFLKGVDTEDVPVLRMIDPSDDHNLLVVARELSPSSGFGGFEFDDDGRSVVLSEWNFLLRIRTTDGRTIADTIVNPPPLAPVENPGPGVTGNSEANAEYISERSHQALDNFEVVDPTSVKLPSLWAFGGNAGNSNNLPTSAPVVEPEANSTESGGSMGWVFVILFGVGLRRVSAN
jgi:sugar lactone lactonase YvrE